MTDYIQAVMSKASYEILDAAALYGKIHGLPGGMPMSQPSQSVAKSYKQC